MLVHIRIFIKKKGNISFYKSFPEEYGEKVSAEEMKEIIEKIKDTYRRNMAAIKKENGSSFCKYC